MKMLKEYLEESRMLDVMYEIDEEFDDWFGEEEVLYEKSETIELQGQKWGDIVADGDEEKKKQAVGIWEKAVEMAKKVKQTFLRWLKKSSAKARNSKVLVDIKSLNSFVDKVLNRNRKASEITDVLRSAVLVDTEEDVDTVVTKIKKDFVIAKHKIKKKDSDTEYGYFGSHHFLVKIGEIFAEIQVMTRRLWSYKEEAHKIYNKYRSVKDADDRIKKMDTELSKALFKIANTETKYKTARVKGVKGTKKVERDYTKKKKIKGQYRGDTIF